MRAMDQAGTGMGNLVRNMCRYAVATNMSDFAWEKFQRGQVITGAGGRITLQVQLDEKEGGQIIDLNEEVGWPRP